MEPNKTHGTYKRLTLFIQKNKKLLSLYRPPVLCKIKPDIKKHKGIVSNVIYDVKSKTLSNIKC